MGLTHAGELRAVRKKLFTKPLPKPNYKPQPRGKFFYSEEAKRWCLPNLASDRSVVSRSQYLNYDLWGLRPVQFSIYFGMQSLWTALGAMLLGLVIYGMTLSAFTRRLLLRVKRKLFFSLKLYFLCFPIYSICPSYILSKFPPFQYPEFFTFGTFARGGPKRSSLSKLRFLVTLTGKGWSKKLPDPSFQHPNPPDTTRTVRVRVLTYTYCGNMVQVQYCMCCGDT